MKLKMMSAASLESTSNKRGTGVLIVVALALVLSACGSAQEGFDRVSMLWSEPTILPCPRFKIMADLAQLVKFRAGPGHDLVDVDVEGQISNVNLACLSKIDKKTHEGNMEVEVMVQVAAWRGPANKTRTATCPYFIVVTDLNETILYPEKSSPETFKVRIEFPGNQTSAKFVGETVVLKLPIYKMISQKDYIIYIGFQLTREQIKYNRATIKSLK
jgi:hypothetical protein